MSQAPVLVVDDDPDIRTLICTALRRDGISCDSADTGEAAIEKLTANAYSVILLDLMMPRVDGNGVIDHMRFSGITTPIVVMTAAGAGKYESLSPMRVKAVITKPFDVEEMLTIVRALVRR